MLTNDPILNGITIFLFVICGLCALGAITYFLGDDEDDW